MSLLLASIHDACVMKLLLNILLFDYFSIDTVQNICEYKFTDVINKYFKVKIYLFLKIAFIQKR